MQHPELKHVDLLTSAIRQATNTIPTLPDDYRFTLAPGNRIVAIHRTGPTLYLDEKNMVWRELTTHISEIQDA